MPAITIEKEIVIPKEQAVFWMDENGRWCNAHGPFEHPKIIAYFNSAIRWDAQGFYVEQAGQGIREKVYFRYVHTALYAVELNEEDQRELVILNTGARVELHPVDLFIRFDRLFLRHQDVCIQFGDRLLASISERIREVNGRLIFRTAEGWIDIEEDGHKVNGCLNSEESQS